MIQIVPACATLAVLTVAKKKYQVIAKPARFSLRFLADFEGKKVYISGSNILGYVIFHLTDMCSKLIITSDIEIMYKTMLVVGSNIRPHPTSPCPIDDDTSHSFVLK